MKVFDDLNFDARACRAELEAFGKLLADHPTLSERDDVLPLFQQNRNLSALSGMLNRSIGRTDRIAFEYDLFGDFAADLVVGDVTKAAYTLIEFEDADEGSVFRAGAKYTHEWSPRFERGYSQVIDWLWKLDDLRATGDFEHRFGSRDAVFSGVLVVGRTQFLPPRERRRLNWRSRKTVVNSEHILCLTFDDFHAELEDRLNALQLMAGVGIK